MDGRWEFAATAGGGTRLTLTLADLPGVARIANGVMEHATALVFRRFHRRLKRALEDRAM